MNITKDPSTLPIIIVTKGKFLSENLKLAGVDQESIKQEIEKIGIKNIKDVLILTLNNTGKIYVQEKNKSFQTIQTNFSGGNW